MDGPVVTVDVDDSQPSDLLYLSALGRAHSNGCIHNDPVELARRELARAECLPDVDGIHGRLGVLA